MSRPIVKMTSKERTRLHEVTRQCCDMPEEEGDGKKRLVTAPGTTVATAAPALWGHVVGFGGGKESSLNCGIARELGLNPTMLMGSPRPSVPAKRWTWPDVKFFRPVNTGVTDRVVVQMMCGGTVIHGSCLDDTWHHIPWHQYYDIGTIESHAQINKLFRNLGIERKVIAPLQPVPCAQVPTILCQRYPEVAEKRRSVEHKGRKALSEKNMHVSLCEMMGGISFMDHCKPHQLWWLIRRFAPRAEEYGPRKARMVAQMGMCSMLYHLRDDKLLEPVRDLIPDRWDRRFIHYGHFYKSVHPGFDEILREYLDDTPVDGSKLEGGVWIE